MKKYVFIVNTEYEKKSLKINEIERKKKELESDFDTNVKETNNDVILNEESKDALDSINKLAFPIETIKYLREHNVITDEQYKEIIINIRKTQAEEDFK